MSFAPSDFLLNKHDIIILIQEQGTANTNIEYFNFPDEHPIPIIAPEFSAVKHVHIISRIEEKLVTGLNRNGVDHMAVALVDYIQLTAVEPVIAIVPALKLVKVLGKVEWLGCIACLAFLF